MGLTSFVRFGSGWAGAGLAMVAGWVAAPEAAHAVDAQPLRLSYELTLGGIAVMSFEFDLRGSADRYAVDFSGRTRGMLNLLGSGYVVSSSQGRLLPDGTPVPDAFVSHSDGNEGEKRSQIQYGPGGPLHWTASPAPGSDGEQLTPIPADSIPGTSDILAGLLHFAAELGRNDSCVRTLKIFDARRRFDLKFSDRGEEKVAPEGDGFYAGAARHCHLDLDRIGGYSTDKSKYMSGDDADFWLAPVLPNEPPLPVEIVFKGRLGLMHARLVVAEHGADRAEKPKPVVDDTPQSALAAPGVDNPR